MAIGNLSILSCRNFSIRNLEASYSFTNPARASNSLSKTLPFRLPATYTVLNTPTLEIRLHRAANSITFFVPITFTFSARLLDIEKSVLAAQCIISVTWLERKLKSFLDVPRLGLLISPRTTFTLGNRNKGEGRFLWT